MARDALTAPQNGNVALGRPAEGARAARLPSWLLWALAALLVGAALFFAFWNLTNYPVTWFDEGSHLHVPKAMVQEGVYADVSSEGYRYYGPTLGVGPTVLVPIAGVFALAGVGLLQARLVIVLFLFGVLGVWYGLTRGVGGRRVALVATLLLAFTPAVALIETGRQLLGEVPALFFLVAGLWLWFARWEKANAWQLLAAGVLMGLSAVTKYQFLLVLAPALLGAWLLNLIWWRRRQALFLLPGIATAATFGLWQLIFLTYLGPSNFSENLAALREISAGAAAVFSPELMMRSLRELVNLRSYFFLLLPVLAWAALRLIWPGRSIFAALGIERRLQLTVLLLLIGANLLWYVAASVSWVRYAFVGLALSSLFVALAGAQLSDGYRLAPLLDGRTPLLRRLLHGGALALLALMILAPAGRLAIRIATAPVDPAKEMAANLDLLVAPTALIETWEPQMGFLTDHTYHYPPQLLLNRAVRQVWLGETPVADLYDFREGSPDYLLLGEFARWVGIYPDERLAGWTVVSESGPYALYRRSEGAAP